MRSLVQPVSLTVTLPAIDDSPGLRIEIGVESISLENGLQNIEGWVIKKS